MIQYNMNYTKIFEESGKVFNDFLKNNNLQKLVHDTKTGQKITKNYDIIDFGDYLGKHISKQKFPSKLNYNPTAWIEHTTPKSKILEKFGYSPEKWAQMRKEHDLKQFNEFWEHDLLPRIKRYNQRQDVLTKLPEKYPLHDGVKVDYSYSHLGALDGRGAAGIDSIWIHPGRSDTSASFIHEIRHLLDYQARFNNKGMVPEYTLLEDLFVPNNLKKSNPLNSKQTVFDLLEHNDTPNPSHEGGVLPMNKIKEIIEMTKYKNLKQAELNSETITPKTPLEDLIQNIHEFPTTNTEARYKLFQMLKAKLNRPPSVQEMDNYIDNLSTEVLKGVKGQTGYAPQLGVEYQPNWMIKSDLKYLPIAAAPVLGITAYNKKNI